MKIDDDTNLFEQVSANDIYEFLQIDKRYFSIKYTTSGHRLKFKEYLIFMFTSYFDRYRNIYIVNEVAIHFGSVCLPSYEILNYLGLDIRMIKKHKHPLNSTYNIATYGQLKQLICPYIKLVEEYKTTEIIEMLYLRAMRSEKMIESIISGLCLSNKNVPPEMILDVIEKKEKL